MIEIRGGTVITMNAGKEIIRNGMIRVENGAITAVGTADQPPMPGAEIVDASGHVVLPGLINTHTHAAMTLFRSYADDLPLMDWLQQKIWPAEERLTAEDIYWGTRLAIQEMALGGITTFNDMYDSVDDVARAVEETGVRGVISRGLIVHSAPQNLRESEDFFRRWHGGADGRVTVMLGPHAPYTSTPEFLREVVASAKNLGAAIHVHLAETVAETEQIMEGYGKRPFAYLADTGMLDLQVIAAHCVWLNNEEIREIAKYRWGIAHNPISNLKLGSGIAPVPEMLNAGIPVGLGTDGAASNNRLDLWSEMKTAAILHKGAKQNPEIIPAYQALEMATILGAKTLGMEDTIGSLEVGKRADIIMVDLDKSHLTPVHDPVSLMVYVATPHDVAHVMVDGDWVVRDGQFLPFEEEIAIRECNIRAKRLVGVE